MKFATCPFPRRNWKARSAPWSPVSPWASKIPANVLNRWMQQREYGLPEDYWDTYTAKIAAITAEDVQRVARKYVPYDNVQIIAVGDGAKIRELLKKFGPVVEVSPGN